MDNTVHTHAQNLNTAHLRKRSWQRFVTVLAAIVVFCTTYALILPAITWESQLICEKELHTHSDDCYEIVTVTPDPVLSCTIAEHQHTDECYKVEKYLACGLEESEEHQHTDECWAEGEPELVCTLEEHTHTSESCYTAAEPYEERVLTCELEEHPAHTDACFDAPPKEEDGFFCGHVEHTHNENCYYSNGELRCTLGTHTHSEECESDKTADVETAAQWEKSFAKAKKTGVWYEDALSIAQTQIGYKESTANFVLNSSGSRMGYTRYGAWYGNPYGDWCAMFCSFCMKYAGVENYPMSASCTTWVNLLRKEGLFRDPANYQPQPGDLVFFNWDDQNSTVEHVGFIYKVKDDGFTTIEGNKNNLVGSRTFSLKDRSIVGYGRRASLLSAECEEQADQIILSADYRGRGSYRWQWQYSENSRDWVNIVGADSLIYSMNMEGFAPDSYFRVYGTPGKSAKSVSETDGLSADMEIAPTAVSVSAAGGVLFAAEPNGLEDIGRIYSEPTQLLGAAGEPTILVVAGSDFQDPATSSSSYSALGYKSARDYTDQNNRIKTILNKIKNNYGDAYAFFAGGDYGFDSNLSQTNTDYGINQVKGAVESVFPGLTQELFVQGNHDNTSSKGNWTATGAYDTAYYGAYLISEDDYPGQTGSQSKTQAVANNLSAYLAGRVSNAPDKPVFIMTHVPLHYSTRTKADGDGMWAKLLYNAIYPYGDELNIIFLYGHNHAWGDDDYLGGSAVFLSDQIDPEATINIADSQTSYTAQPLNFTYMNYGYTGYYWSEWKTQTSHLAGAADSTLTMTAFRITGSTVEITRWDETSDQPHLLKAEGNSSLGKRGVSEVCGVDGDEVTSPQTVTFASPVVPDDPGDDPVTPTGPYPIPGAGGLLTDWEEYGQLNVTAIPETDGAYLTASAIEIADGSTFGDLYGFNLYDVTLTGSVTVPADGVSVYVPAKGMTSVFGIEDGEIVWHDEAEVVTVSNKQYLCFTAEHFSEYGTAKSLDAPPESAYELPTADDVETPPESTYELPDASEIVVPPITEKCYEYIYTSITNANDLKAGDKVVVYDNDNYYLTETISSNRLSMNNTRSKAAVWTVDKDGTTIYLKNSDGQYLAIGNGTASFAGNKTSAAAGTYIGGNTNRWQFAQTVSSTNYYLSDRNDSNTSAAGLSTYRSNRTNYAATAQNDSYSRWNISKVTEGAEIPLHYWELCDSTDDFTADGVYMIVSGTNAFGVNASNNAAAADITVSDPVEIAGSDYYIISGDGAAERYQWSIYPNGTGYRVYNTTSGYYLRMSNTTWLSTTAENETITRSGNYWRIRNGNRYLQYNNGFSRSNNNTTTYADMTIYKLADFNKGPETLLAVQKHLSAYSSKATADTAYTFKLMQNGQSVANASYKVYDANGSVVSSNLKTNNTGSFSLKSGQTAVFNTLDKTKTYVVSETVDTTAIRSTKVSVNDGTQTTGTSASSSFTYDKDNTQSIIRFENTPVPDTLLAVQKHLSAYSSKATADTAFTFRLTQNGASVTNAPYTVYDVDGVTVEATDVTTSDGSFALKSGQTAVFNTLDNAKTYVVTETVDGDAIESTEVSVNNGSYAAGNSASSSFTFDDAENGTQSIIRFQNTPIPDITTLKLSLHVIGRDAYVSNRTDFTFRITDSFGEPAEYQYYQIFDANGAKVGEKVYYADLIEEGSDTSITLRPEQSVNVYGLDENDSYTVTEVLDGFEDGVFNLFSVKVGEEDAIPDVTSATVGAENEVYFTNRLTSFEGYTITFDYGTTSVTRLTDPDGHLTYDQVAHDENGEGKKPGFTVKDWHLTASSAQDHYTRQQVSEMVFTRDTTLYAHWVLMSNSSANWHVTFDKTLDEETAYNDEFNPENFFDIDLKVVLPSSKRLAIVLTLDMSSSMNQFCAVCGNTNGNNHSNSYGHDFVHRLELAKRKAEEFLADLYLYCNTYGVEACYLDVVRFDSTASPVLSEPLDILASGSSITKNGTLESGYTYTSSGNAQTVFNAISGLTYGSGTNITEAMYDSYTILNTVVSDVDKYDVNGNNAYVLLLSDGVPTTNKDQSRALYNYLPAEAVSEDYIAQWKDIWQLYEEYEWHDEDWYDPNASGAKLYFVEQIMGAPYYSNLIHAMGGQVYSVCLGENTNTNAMNSGNNYKYVSGNSLDNRHYIESFSDMSHFATGDDLGDFYKNCITSMSIECRGAVVKDPITPEVEFLYFVDENGQPLMENGVPLTSYESASIGEFSIAPDENGVDTITWHPTVKSTLTYKVRLKNEADGFLDYEDYSKDYLTNGETSLDYSIYLVSTETGEYTFAESDTKYATIPHVHGWLGELTFTKVAGLSNDATAKPLKGVTFVLTHDPLTCEVCRNLAESERAEIGELETVTDSRGTHTVGSLTAVSAANGTVTFDGIPSGHTYMMTEQIPEGYDGVSSFRVKVAYDELTVEPVYDEFGYWTGSRLFNLRIGVTRMPSTGGFGLTRRSMYIIGAAIPVCAGIYVCSLRRKRKGGQR